MGLFTIPDISIKGISVAVPKDKEDNLYLDLIPPAQRRSFIEITGIRYRRIAPAGITAVDLCSNAAENLLQQMKWKPAEVDVCIFVTQTPDHTIPNSASILHYKLGLSPNCIVFDINLGCSGYVYGLSVVGALLQNIQGGKGLLLVGDCSSSVVSKGDKATYPLFSDAGSATAVENTQNGLWQFNLQTDGSGYQDIIVPDGGMKNPFTEKSLVDVTFGPAETRNNMHMKLNGVNIFNFALREVAPNIKALLEKYDLHHESIDYYILHQANKLILDCVRRKLNEPATKFPNSLYQFGNTSSASIPVTIVTELNEILKTQKKHLLLSGFGVGLSWGSVCLSFDKIAIPSLIEV